MTFRGASLVSTMESKKFLSRTNSKDVNKIAPSNRRVSFNLFLENTLLIFFNSKNPSNFSKFEKAHNKQLYHGLLSSLQKWKKTKDKLRQGWNMTGARSKVPGKGELKGNKGGAHTSSG